MVQFGWGSKQLRIQAAETGFTSAISESIAQDKEMTKQMLSRRRRTGAGWPFGIDRRRRLGCRAGNRRSCCHQAA
jgi:hypothetical protein